MGMTITEKILAAHSGRDSVVPGEIVNATLDLIVCHDVTTPPAVQMLRKLGINKVKDPSKILVTPDHFVPNKDIKSAELSKYLREWRIEQGIERYYEIGNHGICHAIAPEQGHVLPGQTIVCGDSHTTTMGALGTFASGVGSTDLAAALATGELWFKVPESMLFELKGTLPRGVYSKDIILYIISKIGVDGARYRAMEYRGDGLKSLTMEARFTITNMAIEAGGKSGIMPADEIAEEYVKARTSEPYTIYGSDDDAVYSDRYTINLSELEPIVALPSLPSNGRFIGEVGKVKMDQVYIGSCTNGRIEDLRIAAGILKGQKVADGTRAIVVPATTEVWKMAMREGLLEIFADAGCVVSTATCGACLGGHMGVLGADETCLSTTNRNFVGRMGSPQSKVYLASPATAAATAITGVITDPREFLD
ncbi:MAG: 3-isopropylmalate dehydratase large subunit [Acidobacteria bacterium]|nr:3-isopropylmalate dehydratase large subunit [Acidobacteriota bacterium]MBI3425760.1 3-isopropylmalate dehydratase large subunit [Acidobacteriota bacterium]